jgi:LacI family transcriptional regulator
MAAPLAETRRRTRHMTEPGPAPRPPTLQDVARRAGVHPATASRALNPQTRSVVSAATVKRVLRAAAALGYEPNPLARGLRTSKTHTVGMFIPDLSNPLFSSMVRGVERVLFAKGYALLLADTDNSVEREASLYAALRVRHVDGLVIATAQKDSPLIDRVTADRMPFVLVNRVSPEHPALAVVGDDAGGVRQAVAHLAGLGHHRIAYLAGPRWTSTGAGRLAAFKQAMAEHGLTARAEEIVECAAWSEQAGAQAMAGLCAAGLDATAVVAGNDMIALGCYDVLRANGVDCPADVSVVGFNDMPFVDKFTPPLTTVRLPNRALGEEGAALLLDRMAGQATTAKTITLPVTLVVRGSTAPPRDR